MDDEAREKFKELMDSLQQQMMQQFFQGMQQSLQNMTPEDIAKMREMIFNDAQAALSVAHEDFDRQIGGPLSPLQLRELAAKLASINLQVESGWHFFSEFDVIAEEYSIRAERPSQVHLPAWDDDLHGAIMYALTKDMAKQMHNGEEISESSQDRTVHVSDYAAGEL